MTTDEIQSNGSWFQTYRGHIFHPIYPHADEIDIEDIAHALSMLCRFSGHVREFYSVAQHSVLVAFLLPQEFKLAGLLHDATEAYMADIPRPLKSALPDYKALEERLNAVIAEKFEIMPAVMHHPKIKRADNIVLMTEARDVLAVAPVAPWGVDVEPMEMPIVPWRPDRAKATFLAMYKHLTSYAV